MRKLKVFGILSFVCMISHLHAQDIKYSIDAETNNAYIRLGAEIVVMEFEQKSYQPGFRFKSLMNGKLPKLPEVNAPFGLDLSGSKLTDDGLKVLKEHKNIVWLNLKNNELTDSGLKELKEMKKLMWVNLEDTKVTAKGQQELKESLPKCKIVLNTP